MADSLYVTARLGLSDGRTLECLVGPFTNAEAMAEWSADFMELGHLPRKPLAKSVSISYVQVELVADSISATVDPAKLASMMVSMYQAKQDLLGLQIRPADQN